MSIQAGAYTNAGTLDSMAQELGKLSTKLCSLADAQDWSAMLPLVEDRLALLMQYSARLPGEDAATVASARLLIRQAVIENSNLIARAQQAQRDVTADINQQSHTRAALSSYTDHT